MSSIGVLAALDAAIDALAAADPADLPDLGVTQRAAQVQTRLCRLQALVSRDVAAVHARGAAFADGFGSTQAFLRRRLRLDARPAARQVQLTQGLSDLPDTLTAFAAGEISVDHVAAICQASKDLGPEATAGGAEKLLLDEARSQPPAAVWRLARLLRERVDPDGEEERQARQHRDRWLNVARTFQGAVAVQGVLDPVTGDLLLDALAAFTSPPSFADGRTPGQRSVDGLADLCRAAIANPPATVPRPQVTITVALDALRGTPGHDAGLLGESGQPICAETARRLACDCGVIPAVLNSVGEPLDIGRQSRLVPTGMRRALALRDKGCRFPGCDKPPAATDAHHITHWARHGPTALRNLVLLCAFHHWLVHEGRWSISFDPDLNLLTAYRPGGVAYDLVSGPQR